jgi:hypothetical protein
MGNAAGKSLPFTQGAPVGGLRVRSPWSVFEGASTGGAGGGGGGAGAGGAAASDGKVLLFRYDKRTGSPRDADMVANALRRLRSLRHPSILKFLVSGGGARAEGHPHHTTGQRPPTARRVTTARSCAKKGHPPSPSHPHRHERPPSLPPRRTAATRTTP